MACARRSRLRECHQSPAFLVPELEADRAQPVSQREHGHVVEDRVLVVGALEVVDARVEVVDVV
jgi:hypothetical protein